MINNGYHLGLVSISFRQHSPLEILQAVKNAGLTCVEWGSDVHAPVREADKIKEIASLQKEFGIFCSSYGSYFHLGTDPIDELHDYAHAASLLGTNIIRLWCGNRCRAKMTDAEVEELYKLCFEAEKIGREHNVIFCMEKHQNTITEHHNDALDLMKAISSPYFRMYWQPLSDNAEENLASAKLLAPYTHHLHVYNWKSGIKYPLAQAIDTWRSYVKEFTLPRTLLLEFMPDNRLTSLATEAAALKNIVGE